MARRKDKLPRGATSVSRAGGETITVALDTTRSTRGRIGVIHSQVHGAHKGSRYQRRQDAATLRGSVRRGEFD